jgi:hypothetical protein
MLSIIHEMKRVWPKKWNDNGMGDIPCKPRRQIIDLWYPYRKNEYRDLKKFSEYNLLEMKLLL